MERIVNLTRGDLFLLDNELYVFCGNGSSMGHSAKRMAFFHDGKWEGICNGIQMKKLDGQVSVRVVKNIEGVRENA